MDSALGEPERRRTRWEYNCWGSFGWQKGTARRSLGFGCDGEAVELEEASGKIRGVLESCKKLDKFKMGRSNDLL